MTTFGSFCSGIGAPEAAWSRLGWSPRFFSEIEPFPCAVLAHRYPDVPNFGDMMKLDTAKLPDAEIWVAGTPCQAFSVAGLRKSLADDRGNLTLHFCRMIHERNPRVVVWENVPGVLSTPDNAFGCFLAGLVGEGQPLVSGGGSWADAGMVIGPRRTAAWRILDAQFFGLAQRRRRVFVVSFRTGDGHNPGAVLFEPESVPRDTPPSRETGSRVAASLTRGTDSGGKGGYAGRRREDDFNIVTNALDAHMGMGGPDDNAAQANHLIPYATADVSPAIKARDYKGPSSDGDGDGDGAILVPMLAHSLRAEGFDASEDGTGRGTPLIPCAIQEDNQNGVTMRDTAGSLRSDAPGTQPCGTLVGVPTAYRTSGNCGVMEQGDKVAALTTNTDPTSNIIAYQQHGSDVGPIGTLRSGKGDVQSGVPFIVHSENSVAMREGGTVPAAFPAVVSRCLDQTGGYSHAQGGTVITGPAPIPIDMRQASRGATMTNNRAEGACSGGAPGTGIGEAGDPSPTVASSHTPAVAYGVTTRSRGSDGKQIEWQEDQAYALLSPGEGGRSDNAMVAYDVTSNADGQRTGAAAIDVAPPLDASCKNGPVGNQGGPAVASPSMAVRRLTPRECERLQGFPDDFTLIPFRGKPAADGPRYRALGNSMAVPVLEWIGRRIEKVLTAAGAAAS